MKCVHIRIPAFFLFIVRRLHFLVPASFTRYPTHFGNRGVLATPAVAVGAAHPRHTFFIRLCFRKLLKKVFHIGFSRKGWNPFFTKLIQRTSIDYAKLAIPARGAEPMRFNKKSIVLLQSILNPPAAALRASASLREAWRLWSCRPSTR